MVSETSLEFVKVKTLVRNNLPIILYFTFFGLLLSSNVAEYSSWCESSPVIDLAVVVATLVSGILDNVSFYVPPSTSVWFASTPEVPAGK